MKKKYSDSKHIVSIIIPTFNYAHFISHALESVLEQKLNNIEIIVVDDGSTDQTADVVADYRRHVKYVYQGNMGLSAARNTGMDHAQGDFLLFFDADDMLGPGVLASQRHFLAEHSNVDIVVCENRLFQECGALGTPKPSGQWRLFRQDLELHLCHFNIAPPHAFMLRRQIAESVGPFDTGMRACEDHDFWFRCVASGGKVAPNHGVHVFYRRHAGSLSTNTENQTRHDAIMHIRIGSYLLSESAKKNLRIDAALTACTAGCLHTAYRIAQERDVAQDLATMAVSCLECITEAPTGHYPVPYFSARIRHALSALSGTPVSGINRLHELVEEKHPDPELSGRCLEELDLFARQRHVLLC
jgi:GT2 family glycosyltransferase